MSIQDWLQWVLLAAVMGAVGQLVRTISGTFKHARMRAECPERADEFSLRQLVIGAVVGAVTGVIAAMLMLDKVRAEDGRLLDDIPGDLMMGLAAAGYAGTDFIEGAVGKFFGSRDDSGAANASPTKATVSVSSSGTPPDATPPVSDGSVG